MKHNEENEITFMTSRKYSHRRLTINERITLKEFWINKM
jgi:hypothetical protein